MTGYNIENLIFSPYWRSVLVWSKAKVEKVAAYMGTLSSKESKMSQNKISTVKLEVLNSKQAGETLHRSHCCIT